METLTPSMKGPMMVRVDDFSRGTLQKKGRERAPIAGGPIASTLSESQALHTERWCCRLDSSHPRKPHKPSVTDARCITFAGISRQRRGITPGVRGQQHMFKGVIRSGPGTYCGWDAEIHAGPHDTSRG